MMSTVNVIRVRRKRTQDPLENLVLPLKRTKVNKPTGGTGSQGSAASATGQDDNKAVFTFAGTVERKNQPISVHVQSALRRASIGLQPKKPVRQSQQSVKAKTESNRTGAREKARSSHKAASKNRRLKVVESARGLKLHELDKDAQRFQSPSRRPLSNGSGALRSGLAGNDPERLFTLVDVEHEEEVKKSTPIKSKTPASKSKKSGSDDITCNSVKMTREKVVIGEDVIQESEYVYDLYYTDCSEFDFGDTGRTIGLRAEKEDLVYEYFADNQDLVYDDEDDENDESNWRNDYPDEEEHRPDHDMFDELVDDYNYASSDEDDLVAQYSKFKLGSKGGDDSDSDLDDYDL